MLFSYNRQCKQSNRKEHAPMHPSSGKLIKRHEVPQYLRDKYGITYKYQSLAVLAAKGQGPRYVKIGRDAYSKPEWIDSWVESQMAEA